MTHILEVATSIDMQDTADNPIEAIVQFLLTLLSGEKIYMTVNDKEYLVAVTGTFETPFIVAI